MYDTTRVWTLVTLAAVMFTAACRAGDRGGGVVVRDSAGVTIVENQEAEWRDGAAWHLSAEPVLELGMVDGPEPYQLHRARDVARLPDGRIAVANAGSGHIRLFDVDGTFIQELGGEGEGPGEFRLVQAIQIQADTLFAYDGRLRRLTLFHLDGQLLRVASLDVPEPSATSFRYPPVWAGGGSMLLFGGAGPPAAMDALARPPVAVLEFSTSGALLDTLAPVPGPEQATWEVDGGGSVTASPPFGRRPVMAARGGRAFVGHQTRYEVTVYDLTGTVERRIRWIGPPLELTEAAREEWERSYMERSTQSEEASRMVVRMAAGAPLPKRRPAYSEIRVATSGHLWVADHGLPIPGVEPTRWRIFTPEGRLLGTVEVPDRLRLCEIGEDYVLGVGRDEYDVEYVRMYRLNKTSDA